MIMTTIDRSIERNEKILEQTRQAIARFAEELDELRERLATETGETLKKTGTTDIKRVTGLLDTCFDVENRLEKLEEKKSGIVQNGVAYDLDAARAALGCKLDRLRACCHAD